MRISLILIALWALCGCERQAAQQEQAAPEQGTPEQAAAEQAVEEEAVEAEAAHEQAAEEQGADDRAAGASQKMPAEAAAAPAPDPDAPSNVGAPPKGAKRTDSGVAWVRLKKGRGSDRPDRLDSATIEYTGWTPDGRKFDSSDLHGDSLVVRPSHLIPGLAEVVQRMLPGEKRRLWIPAKLGYGEPGAVVDTAPSQPLGDLVYDLELVSFESAPDVPPPPAEVGAIPADAERGASGLAWRVLEPGNGTEHPVATSVVDMTYTLWTSDGEVVDSSALRGGVDTLGIARLVPGWFEGMQLMVEGERRLFWIPEPLAFAGQPHRPSGMLVVDVSLIQIRRELHQVR